MHFGECNCQVINGDFNTWIEAQDFGEPFENPIGWSTNNETTPTGFANTPIEKRTEESNCFANISSSFQGLDTTSPGILSQTFLVSNP